MALELRLKDLQRNLETAHSLGIKTEWWDSQVSEIEHLLAEIRKRGLIFEEPISKP
jgi:hypothetical protein